MVRKLIASIIGISGLALAGSASAITMTFNTAGQELDTFYVFSIDGSHVNVEVKYTLTSISSTEADFAIDIINTSTNDAGVSATDRIVSFGVDTVEPALTGATTSNSSTAGEWNATTNTNFPSFHTVDLCAYAGPNCSGGASNGTNAGQEDTFDLQLTGSFGAVNPSITFTSPFPGKFQDVGKAGKSYEIDACANDQNSGTPTPDQPVPEPGTLALFGLAAWGVYMNRRRAAP